MTSDASPDRGGVPDGIGSQCASPRRRVAVLHFTALPVVGGVEEQIEAQCLALSRLGYDVRLIVGEGDAPPGVDLVRIPSLLTWSAGATRPAPDLLFTDDTRVRKLEVDLRRALAGCSVCIVHNALTVYLNPGLTAALLRITQNLPAVGWISWSYDLTDATSFWPGLGEGGLAMVRESLVNMRCVVPSFARASELSRLFGVNRRSIDVIAPVVRGAEWLRLGTGAQRLVGSHKLLETEPLVLVPAKSLPHKNLELAVRAAAALRRLSGRSMVLITAVASVHQPELSETILYRLQDLAETLDVAGGVRFLSTDTESIDRDTVRDLMLLADVVLLPSREEGYGLPIREAIALRTPVLCSDIPAFREAAAGAASFFPVTIDPLALGKAIVEIAAQPQNRERRRTLRSWSSYAGELSRVIEQVLRDPEPARAGIGHHAAARKCV